MDTTILVIVATLSGMIVSWLGIHFNSKRDSKNDGVENGVVLTKLDFIQNDLKDIKAENKSTNEAVKDHERRLGKVEGKVDNLFAKYDEIKGVK